MDWGNGLLGKKFEIQRHYRVSVNCIDESHKTLVFEIFIVDVDSMLDVVKKCSISSIKKDDKTSRNKKIYSFME